MKLGTQVGIGPGHVVLDGDLAPHPQRGTAPNFRPIIVAKMARGIEMLLGMEVGLGQGDFVCKYDLTVGQLLYRM